MHLLRLVTLDSRRSIRRPGVAIHISAPVHQIQQHIQLMTLVNYVGNLLSICNSTFWLPRPTSKINPRWSMFPTYIQHLQTLCLTGGLTSAFILALLRHLQQLVDRSSLISYTQVCCFNFIVNSILNLSLDQKRRNHIEMVRRQNFNYCYIYSFIEKLIPDKTLDSYNEKENK